MARANDLVVLNATAGQLAAVMGADILDRIEGLVKPEHCDTGAVYLDMYRLARGTTTKYTSGA